MTTPRLLFAGTPEFALASLKALLANAQVPVAVLTQPDRPAGRGKQLTASPVKQFALEQGIVVLQPDSLREQGIADRLAAYQADLMIVAAYGLLLPQAVLDLPAKGCLNVHASLLPRWRGAAPIQAAILAGDRRTGISLMAMTAGLDCGPVFVSSAIDIGDQQTAGQLHDTLAALGGELLVRHLPAILRGELDAVEQDESDASYAGKVRTGHAELDWSEPAEQLARKVRAYNPVPGAWFMYAGERIKCWRASIDHSLAETLDVGVVDLRDGLAIGCGNGVLRLERLQRPGRRPVSAQEFAQQVDLVGVTLPARARE
jgi:methionyl-tRNA formyltransferase